MMKIKKFFKKLSTFNFQLSTPKGFTLIELLVAIVIIGLLAAGIFSVLNPLEQIKKPRDSQRKHDFDQLRKALEIYFINNGSIYPSTDGTVPVEFGTAYQGKIEGKDWGTPWLPYIPKLPNDPLDSQPYIYRVAIDQTWYRLFAKLERCQDPDVMPDPDFTNCRDYYNYSVASPNREISLFSGPTPAPPTPTNTPAPTPTPIGLIGEWSFNLSTDPGQDTSGNNRHGTVNGATWQNASTCGSGSGCLSFDGVDDYITLGGDNIFNETGLGSTTLFRLRPLALGGPAGYMMIIRFKATTEFLISIGATGNPQQGGTSVYFGFRGQTAITNSTDAYLNDFQNTWKKFAVTYNGGPKGNTSSYKAYVDGSPITLSNTTGIGGSAINTNEIGRNQEGTTNPGWINGYLDEVRLYNRVLTQAEIQNL